MAELVDRLTAKTDPPAQRWVVAAETARWLRGRGAPPRVVRLETTSSGVTELHRLLMEYVTEPAGRTIWPPQQTVTGARAFIGNVTSGLEVEWLATPALSLGGQDTIKLPWKDRIVPISPT